MKGKLEALMLPWAAGLSKEEVYWGHIGVILGLYWVILRSYGGYIGVVLELY